MSRNVNYAHPAQLEAGPPKRTLSEASTHYSGSRTGSEQNLHAKKPRKGGTRRSGLASFIKNQRKLIKQSFQQQHFNFH